MVLLDTTFLIDLMRGRDRAVNMLDRLESEGVPLALAATSLMEFHRGIETVDLSPAEKQRIARVVRGRPIHPLDPRAAERAGGIDATLWSRGEPIDPEDACIAGIALSRDEEVVTRRGRVFGRVDGLRLRTY